MTERITFTIKPEHLRLLRTAYWRWDESYEGAPAIDAKRPWGFSHSRLNQIAEHAGVPTGEEYVQEHADELRALWRECETVLQIGVACGQMRPGQYRRTDDGWRWAENQTDPVAVMRKLLDEARGENLGAEERAIVALFEAAVEAYDTDPSPVVEAVVALALTLAEMPEAPE